MISTLKKTHIPNIITSKMYTTKTLKLTIQCVPIFYLKKNQLHTNQTILADGHNTSITNEVYFLRNSKLYIPHLTANQRILSDSDSNDSHSKRRRILFKPQDTRPRRSVFDQHGSNVLDIDRSNKLLLSGIFPLRRNGTMDDKKIPFLQTSTNQKLTLLKDLPPRDLIHPIKMMHFP